MTPHPCTRILVEPFNEALSRVTSVISRHFRITSVLDVSERNLQILELVDRDVSETASVPGRLRSHVILIELERDKVEVRAIGPSDPSRHGECPTELENVSNKVNAHLQEALNDLVTTPVSWEDDSKALEFRHRWDPTVGIGN